RRSEKQAGSRGCAVNEVAANASLWPARGSANGWAQAALHENASAAARCAALNRNHMSCLPIFSSCLLLFDRNARHSHAFQVLTTFRCAGEFDSVGSSSDFIAASTPPARCGTPAAANPISTPDNAPIRVSALHSP